MARRSHHETYILLRNNAQKNRSFYKNFSKDDERVKLVEDYNESQDDIELDMSPNRHSSDSFSVNQPSWLSSLEEFRYDSFNVTQKIEQLKQLQEEHLKLQNNAIFANEAVTEKMRQVEQQIDRKCKELSALFNRLHSILTHFKTLKSYPLMKSRLLTLILKNIFQFQVQEVVRLTQLFRSCQRVYMERRNQATTIDKEFVITFNEDALFDELNDDIFSSSSSFPEPERRQSQKQVRFDNGQSIFFDNSSDEPEHGGGGQSQQSSTVQLAAQLEIDSSLNDHLRQRQKEMDVIMKSFVELNQMFQEVNNFVVDHGSALDRIDFNIEQVEHRVELGAVSLEKAHRKIARMRKIKFVLASGFLVFILFLLIVIRS